MPLVGLRQKVCTRSTTMRAINAVTFTHSTHGFIHQAMIDNEHIYNNKIKQQQ